MGEHTPTPWYHRQAGEVGRLGQPYDWIGDSPNHGQHRRIIVERNSCVPADYAFICKAVNNHEALVTFFKWAMQEGPWAGGDLDGASIQDKAESLGLIVPVAYDPEKHGAYNDYGCDAGDPWFEFSPQITGHVGSVVEGQK